MLDGVRAVLRETPGAPVARIVLPLPFEVVAENGRLPETPQSVAQLLAPEGETSTR